MQKTKAPQITQIIALQKPVFALYREDDGSLFPREIRVVGLSSDGTLSYLDSDDMGMWEDATSAENFVRFEYGDEPNLTRSAADIANWERQQAEQSHGSRTQGTVPQSEAASVN